MNAPCDSWTGRGFAVRRVRPGGRVKIGGVWFTPREEYHGELDGQVLAFGRYRAFVTRGPYEPFVCLWGSAERFWSDDPDTDWPGPHCIDGFFHWEWWEPQLQQGARPPSRVTHPNIGGISECVAFS